MAIALGSQGEVPLESGDFDKGFVHVLDEASCSSSGSFAAKLMRDPYRGGQRSCGKAQGA